MPVKAHIQVAKVEILDQKTQIASSIRNSDIWSYATNNEINAAFQIKSKHANIASISPVFRYMKDNVCIGQENQLIETHTLLSSKDCELNDNDRNILLRSLDITAALENRNLKDEKYNPFAFKDQIVYQSNNKNNEKNYYNDSNDEKYNSKSIDRSASMASEKQQKTNQEHQKMNIEPSTKCSDPMQLPVS